MSSQTAWQPRARASASAAASNRVPSPCPRQPSFTTNTPMRSQPLISEAADPPTFCLTDRARKCSDAQSSDRQSARCCRRRSLIYFHHVIARGRMFERQTVALAIARSYDSLACQLADNRRTRLRCMVSYSLFSMRPQMQTRQPCRIAKSCGPFI